MEQLWSVYHNEIPSFLREFAQTPPLLRLKRVGMNCGCEYTAFPLFSGLQPYSRYDHSIGTALIVWHFTRSMEQTLAALFHDVTTPCFAHVVDFLNGDHLRQESTETGVASCLMASEGIQSLFQRYNIPLEAVSDYHCYPIADNDSPALSADRLEYTMGNLLNYGFADIKSLGNLYEDLEVGLNESGREELMFRTSATAVDFAMLALKTSHIYIADEDRFSMQALADLLRSALERGELTRGDLLGTEPEIIKKLENSQIGAAEWTRFCGYSRMMCTAEEPETGYRVRVDAKKRWIDPYVMGYGRVSQYDGKFAAAAERFQNMDFSAWLSAT